MSTVFTAVMRAYGYVRDVPFPASEAGRASACVPTVADLRFLWLAGVAPSYVATVHDALGVPGCPLPVNFYLGLVTRRPDLAWVASGAARSADSDPPLPWTEPSPAGAVPGAPREWLSTRLPEAMIMSLTKAGYLPEDLLRLASATRRPVVGVASMLQAWVAAGCRPSPTQLIELHEAGVSPYWTPSAAAMHRLRIAVGRSRPTVAEDQLGFMLAVCGSVPQALAWVRAGHRDALRVAAALARRRGPHDIPSTRKATHARAR